MEGKLSTRRQSRATVAERERMVRQFQDSGLSRRDFSKQYGVPLSTLGWWLAKAKGKSAAEPVVFSEIRIIPSEERLRPKGDWAMEIEPDFDS